MNIATISPTLSQSLDVLAPRDVSKMLSLSLVVIWRLRQKGHFPEPIQISPKRIGYRRSDLEQWLATRPVRSLRKDRS